MKKHLPILLAGLISGGRSLTAIGATALGPNSAPSNFADSLPFAALIGLIAVGAVLVLRKMIRDLS